VVGHRAAALSTIPAFISEDCISAYFVSASDTELSFLIKVPDEAVLAALEDRQ
jgi:hypothetical protein